MTINCHQLCSWPSFLQNQPKILEFFWILCFLVAFTPKFHIPLEFPLGFQINLTDASRAVWGVLQIETPRRKMHNLIMYKCCPWPMKGIKWCSIHVLSFMNCMNWNKTVSLWMHHTYMCNHDVLIKPATGFSSEIGTKLRDWAVGQAWGQLLLSGSIVLKWLKDAVQVGNFFQVSS